MVEDQEQVAGATAPKRAGTARVVGTMAAIALVAVTAVVVSARVGGNATADDGVEEAVPTTLAGGIAPGPVPAAITDSFEGPVLGAVDLENPPQEAVASCSESMGVLWDEGQPDVETAIATPDGLYLSLLGSGTAGPEMGMDGGGGLSEQFRISCAAQSEGDGWSSQGGGMEFVGEGQEVGGGFGGSSFSCCDEQGLATATGTVEVPEDSEWAVQDRHGWYLAYPTLDRDRLVVTWKYRESAMGGGAPPQSRVTFLDGNGAVVGEAFAGGRF